MLLYMATYNSVAIGIIVKVSSVVFCDCDKYCFKHMYIVYIISTLALFCYVHINTLSLKESSILSSGYSFTVTFRLAVIIFGAGLATILKHRVNILGLLWRAKVYEKCRQNGVSSPYLAVMWPVYNFFYLKNSVILSPQLSRVPKWYTMLRNCSNDASRSIQSTKIYTKNFFTVFRWILY